MAPKVGSQDWFEFSDLAGKGFDKSVWIPLWASQTIRKEKTFGQVGYVDESFVARSVLVPSSDAKALADDLTWNDFIRGFGHRPFVANEKYFEASDFTRDEREVLGLALVLEQHVSSIEKTELHLHQDFVLAYNLLREGPEWLAVDEGYQPVAKHEHSEDSRSLLVRSEFLLDYLAARDMALLLATYRGRDLVRATRPSFSWGKKNAKCRTTRRLKLDCRYWSIHEGGGMPFGGKTAVFKISRTDIDPEDDVPVMGEPNDQNTTSESRSFARPEREVIRVEGRLWKKEIIRSGKSPRLRGDKKKLDLTFVVEHDGTRATSAELDDEDVGRWLWFRPELANQILTYRNSSLTWYTRHTGDLRVSPDYPVHFGVNRLGLVNTYAYDVANLPDWQQRIWAGFNIAPEGGVSDELLASHARATPATTQAPEAFLERAIIAVGTALHDEYKIEALREPASVAEILRGTHRFQSVNRAGLLKVAKDLNRLFVERLDVGALRKALALKDDKRGSLKLLTDVLANHTDAEQARSIVGPLVGIYDLRLSDAHISGNDVDAALALAGVSLNQSQINQGAHLLHNFVRTLFEIAEQISKGKGIAV